MKRGLWWDKTWNPVTGCSPISEGCANCWAKRMSKRLAGRYGYPKDEPFRVTLHLEKMIEPFGWKKPKKIFVCSMGDLFHRCITDFSRLLVMNTILGCIHHTFLCLTKRPLLAQEYFGNNPLPKNLWLGISVENQKWLDGRWKILSQIQASIYFISYEPALGPIILPKSFLSLGKRAWLICGGETGPKASPMHPDWARSVRDQCQGAGVPFFFKQWGEYSPYYEWGDKRKPPRKIGTKTAGRLLDGRTWEEMP